MTSCMPDHWSYNESGLRWSFINETISHWEGESSMGGGGMYRQLLHVQGNAMFGDI
jgi:hypothetical protein